MRVVPQYRSGAVKTVGAILVMLLLFGSLAIVGIGGAASVTVADSAQPVNQNTESVYLEVTNLNTTTQASLSADFVAYDANGNEVTNKTGVAISVAADSTVKERVYFDYTAGTIDSVNVTATVDNTTVSATEIETTVATFEQIHKQNVTVTEDTDSLFVELDNNGSSEAFAEADFVAFDENDTEVTNVTGVSVSALPDSTSMVQPGLDLSSGTVQYVTVTGLLDTASIAPADATITSGTLEATFGGAGGFDLGSMSMTEYGVIAVVIVGFLYVIRKEQ